MIRKPSTLILSLMICCACAVFAIAQAVYGSVFGTITDARGSGVPGATVTITNTGTNVAETIKTDGSGYYNRTRLIPGRYRIKVEAGGFKTAVIETVVVSVDTASEANVVLQPGEINELITISEPAPALMTDRSEVSVIFENRQITDLPILDRNFTKFILLTPGAQQLGWQQTSAENPQGSTQTMVNGQHFSGTGYQLDGTENRDPILGLIVVNPNVEAIGETKITSQNYDAEFGQAIAGVVSVSTKSGTNDLHGAAFLFRQNDTLQARNPLFQFQKDPTTGKFIPDTLRNQFGGAVGGPIIKDRLFFFSDYEGARSRVGGSRLLTVPTAAARQGDLSAYLGDVIRDAQGNPIRVTTVSGAEVDLRQYMIFDPATTVSNAAGELVDRRAFDGAVIPANRLSQQALNVLRLIPMPNVANAPANGTLNNFVASGSEKYDKDSFDIRIDAKYSDKLNMFGRYSFADFRLDGPTAFGEGGGPEIVSFGGQSKGRNQSVAYGLDYTWNDRLVTDLRFGFFRYRVNVLPSDFGQNTASDVGVPGLNLDSFSSGLFAGFVIDPRIQNIAGGFSLGTEELRKGFNFGSGQFVNRCGCPLDEEENQFQVVSNTTRLYGAHTIKFGADVRRAYNLRVPSDLHRSGELTFGTGLTRGVGGGGLGLATLLLGDVTEFGRYISSNTDARERQWRHFYYGQDTWRATSKLTVNYGLRLDVVNPQTVNRAGEGGFLDLNTGEIKVAGVGDTSLSGNVENSLNFAPRLSVAYKATDKLVIRAGYGRSYDVGVFGSVFGHTVTQNLPALAVQRLNAPSNFDSVFTLNGGPPAFTAFFGLDDTPKQGGKPNTSLPPDGRFFLPDGVFARAILDKQRLPSVDAYNLTLQFQLTNTISVEAAYVGNKGTHVFPGDGPQFDANQPTIEGFGTVPLDQRRPLFNKFGWTQSIDYFCNCADDRYDSVQFKLTKRLSKGYAILAHYTLQRSLQDAQDYFVHDQALNRGVADWNRTHSFVFSQIWELPFGKGKRYLGGAARPLDLLIGGWQVNSNTIIQSGLPYNFCYDASANIDTGPCRPNVSGDPKARLSGGQYSYDTSVFSNPGKGRFGDQERNALRGPAYWRTDASLFKKFRLAETKELEFRIESVNVFNHVNLGNPDSSIGSFDQNGKLNVSPTLGRIFTTAAFGADPMRNIQFALKLKF
ncbi:MAG TPA: TonB-dependent receptor [Blastocatellia bacterium]|nr:TonB-dependent receptor [Blastocatellia bacterium]